MGGKRGERERGGLQLGKKKTIGLSIKSEHREKDEYLEQNDVCE